MSLGSENGVVVANVHVVGVGSEHTLIKPRYVGKVFVRARRRFRHISVFLGFFVSLARKVAGHHVVGFAALVNIERYRFKLHARAALNEYNIVIFGHVHQFAQTRFRFVVYSLIRF